MAAFLYFKQPKKDPLAEGSQEHKTKSGSRPFKNDLLTAGEYMDYVELNGSEDAPFAIDMTTWPNCTALLGYLEKRLGIIVLSKSAWLPSGDYFAEFQYQGVGFEIQTPLSTPWLVAKKGCSRDLFNVVLEQIDQYHGGLPFGGFAWFKYLLLPAYQGNFYEPDQ